MFISMRPKDTSHADPVILGAAYNYGESAVRPFVESVRKSGNECRVVLGVAANMTPMLASFYNQYGIEFDEITDTDRNMSPHPKAARFVWYSRHLSKLRYNQPVLLTDVRDVFVQSNELFKDVRSNEVQLFGEIGTFAQYAVNLNWVSKFPQIPNANWWKPKVVVNSGIMLGTAGVMKTVVDRIVREIKVRSNMFQPNDFHDQAYVNYLFHMNQLAGTYLNKYGSGNVFTIGSVRYRSRVDTDARLYRDNDGFVCKETGKRVPVIHQYDRWSSLLIPWMNDMLTKSSFPKSDGQARTVWWDVADAEYAVKSCYTYKGAKGDSPDYTTGHKLCHGKTLL